MTVGINDLSLVPDSRRPPTVVNQSRTRDFHNSSVPMQALVTMGEFYKPDVLGEKSRGLSGSKE